jgi:hypothetical protein
VMTDMGESATSGISRGLMTKAVLDRNHPAATLACTMELIQYCMWHVRIRDFKSASVPCGPDCCLQLSWEGLHGGLLIYSPTGCFVRLDPWNSASWTGGVATPRNWRHRPTLQLAIRNPPVNHYEAVDFVVPSDS